MKNKVIIYTRVSTDEQADSGFSLRHQKEMLERYCEINKIEILKHFEEDYSAKNFNRPEWTKLEHYVKANKKSIDKVLVLKWDRFSRNIEEALGKIRCFRDWGIAINSIEQPLDLTNPDNKLMLTFYLTIPEIENDKISQRTKDGVVRARKEGAYTSKPPFGYKRLWIDKKASMEPDENSALVRELFEKVSKGLGAVEHIRKSYRKKGFKLCKQSFYNILRSRLYLGQVKVPEHKGEDEYWHNGLHDAIIDEVTFQRVQVVLSERLKKAKYPTKRNENLPLRSFLKCGACGENLTGSISKGNGGMYGYYHCRKGCKNRVSTKKAHQLFHTTILGRLTVNKNVLSLYQQIVVDLLKKKKGDHSLRIKTIEDEIIKTHEDIETLEDKLISGGIEDATFNKINKRYSDKIMALKAELHETKANKDTSLKHIEKAFHTIGNLGEIFNNSNYDQKVTLLGLLFPQKLVLSKNECRTTEQNIVIELLCRVNEGFKRLDMKKAIKNDGLSNLAPQTGLEPVSISVTISVFYNF